MTSGYNVFLEQNIKFEDFHVNEFTCYPRFIFRGENKLNNTLIPKIFRTRDDNRTYVQMAKNILDKYHSIRGTNSKLCGWNDDDYNHEDYEKALILLFGELANAQGLNLPKGASIPPMSFIDMLLNVKNIKFNNIYFLELAALAQHYGLPTRLLDWTYDPNVALYFASRKNETSNNKMVVYCLDTFCLKQLSKSISIVNPSYADNPNLCSQRGVLTCITNYDSEEMRTMSFEKIIEQWFDRCDDNTRKFLSDQGPVLVKYVISYDNYEKMLKSYYSSSTIPMTIFPGYKGVADTILDFDI